MKISEAATAYHEAGHVVAAYAEGIAITKRGIAIMVATVNLRIAFQ